MTEREITAPFDEFRDIVRPDWIDNNNHMNMGFYLVVFDLATDAWMPFIGLDQAYRKANNSTTFSLEAHITYDREVRVNAPLRFTTRLIDFDAKRIHYIHQMYHGDEGYLASTNELLSLHVSQECRRAATMSDAVLARLARIKSAHERVPLPRQAGRRLGLDQKPK